MKILVIGGSYFYGRVFVMLAAQKHDVTVVNRGTYSMEEFGVRQIRGDRHDPLLWKRCGGDYDVVVDFCAYERGDIKTVLENLPGRPGQYIFISTVDVYQRRSGAAAMGAEAEGSPFKDETFPLEERRFPGEAGAYISGKVALERELRQACEETETVFTVLRPAILYGPYNYAPREALFVRMAVREHALPRFTDADGRFQLVYVKDAADAALKCLGNEKSYGQAYNLCGDEAADYAMFFRELAECAEAAGVEASEFCVTLREAEEKRIPVPFPATTAETELVSNEKSREELGMEYTPLAEGMRRTFRAFSRVYAE